MTNKVKTHLVDLHCAVLAEVYTKHKALLTTFHILSNFIGSTIINIHIQEFRVTQLHLIQDPEIICGTRSFINMKLSLR